MTLADEQLDVLQNIEFAILSVYKEHSDLRDTHVMRALDALIDFFRAEARGHTPKDHKLPEKETLVFERVKSMCEMRLDREKPGTEFPDELIGNKTPDEILACLRKIRKSTDRWNSRGGQQGYLKFISHFIK